MIVIYCYRFSEVNVIYNVVTRRWGDGTMTAVVDATVADALAAPQTRAPEGTEMISSVVIFAVALEKTANC